MTGASRPRAARGARSGRSPRRPAPRIARSGRSKPAISTMVSMRASASRGELAWTVDSEPSWPVFIAWSMSSASAPRTSPTMIRSGRMRSALRTRSRIATSPSPSMFFGRDSSRRTWRWSSCSSAASSIVTMRSCRGSPADSAFSSVVLPVPVPPEMRMFSSRLDAAAQEVDRLRLSACRCARARRRSRRFCAELADRQQRPVSESGGMTALTRRRRAGGRRPSATTRRCGGRPARRSC